MTSKPISEQDAHAIGVDAYVYFYPLVTMDITRKQSTNIEPGKEFGKGPMNMFVSIPAYPPADLKVVVRVNFDTLYSIAWLDLTKEPRSSPRRTPAGGTTCCRCSTCGRTSSRRPAGARRAPRRAISWSRRPAGAGRCPQGFTRIAAPTPYVWVIGRTKTDGPADYAAVHKIQAGYKVTPLSRLGQGPRAGRGEDRPERGHEDAAEDPGRHHAGRQILRLRGRTAQAAPAAHHRPADPRADEADRHRAGQELRLRQARPRREEGARRRARGRPAAHGVEGADARPRRQRLVDEHRHHGRLRQLLPQARHRRAAGPRRQPARGRDLSAESRRRHRQAARRRATSTRSTSTRGRRRR